MTWIATLTQGQQLLATLVLAVYASTSASAALLGFLSTAIPWPNARLRCKVAASFFGDIGASLHKVGEFIGRSTIGGSRGFASRDAIKWAWHGMLVAYIAIVAGCGLIQAIAPASIDCAENVILDVIAKKPLSEIFKDCGGDVVTVITTVLKSNDPAVIASPAYAEAKRMRMALTRTDPAPARDAGGQ